MDKDPEAIAVAEREFGGDARVAIRRGSFADLARLGRHRATAWTACCSTWACRRRSSMSPNAASASARTARWTCAWIRTAGESAAQWLARADEREIADVLWTYGEERQSRRIARAIVARRAEAAADAHRAAGRADRVGRCRAATRKIHPATRSFQAIRIFINRELADLEAGLDAALRAPQARRPAGGDQLPFAGRPHRQAVHRAATRRRRRQPPHAGAQPRSRRRCARSATRRRPTTPNSPPIRARAARCCAWRRSCPRELPHERAPAARRVLVAGQRRQPRSAWCTRATSTAQLFVAADRLEQARDELNIEFGRLQLEQATWAESNRIDQVARDRLGMKFPEAARHRGGAPMSRSRHVATPAKRRRAPRRRFAQQPAAARASTCVAAGAGRRRARPVFAGAGRARGRPAAGRQRFLPRAGRRALPARDRRSRPRAA